jgi:hypothetical protein
VSDSAHASARWVRGFASLLEWITKAEIRLTIVSAITRPEGACSPKTGTFAVTERRIGLQVRLIDLHGNSPPTDSGAGIETWARHAGKFTMDGCQEEWRGESYDSSIALMLATTSTARS